MVQGAVGYDATTAIFGAAADSEDSAVAVVRRATVAVSGARRSTSTHATATCPAKAATQRRPGAVPILATGLCVDAG